MDFSELIYNLEFLRTREVIVEKAPFWVVIENFKYYGFYLWYQNDIGKKFLVRTCTTKDVSIDDKSSKLKCLDFYVIVKGEEKTSEGSIIFREHCKKIL